MESITKIRISHIIIILIVPVLLWKCASQLPPGGGEVDKIAPEIVDTYPQSGTINFNEQTVEFEFSEYIDKRSIFDAIFISPAIDKGIEYDWSGKSLSMNFEEPLQKDMTYTITIGTNLADLNNKNKMNSAFNLTFSTGNIIDKGIINGKVFTTEPENVMIFAYLLDSLSIDPSEYKPNYISQIGLDGKYSISGLANGEYLVFAVKDEFKDLLYNIGTDKYGSPNRLVTLSDKDSIQTNVNFLLNIEDTLKPNIADVIMTDQNHIMIEFSEFIDSSNISAQNIYVYDSTSMRKFNIQYFYKGQAAPKKYFVSLKDSLNDEDENYLVSNNIYDLHENYLNNESYNFTVSTKPDTNSAQIIKSSTGFKDNDPDFKNTRIPLNFDDGINFDELKSKIFLNDTKNNSIPIKIIKKDDASFIIIPEFDLRPKTAYELKINLNYAVDAAGNTLDSIYLYKFKTLSDLYFSGVSGKVVSDTTMFPMILQLESVDKKTRDYSLQITDNNQFDFSRILPGKYILWAFVDKDSSRTYNYGRINPFEKSERFTFYPDTLNLRARWPVGDIYIEFK